MFSSHTTEAQARVSFFALLVSIPLLFWGAKYAAEEMMYRSYIEHRMRICVAVLAHDQERVAECRERIARQEERRRELESRGVSGPDGR
jgi:hypothetical protein